MVGATAILGLAVAALAGASWAYVAAIPWYANGLRVGAPTAVVLLVVAGHGVAMVRWSAARLALIPLVAVLAVGGLVVGLDVGTTSYAGKSVVTDADRAAFVWLGSHVTAGTRVLNDSHDGSMWMYDLAGVAPVFGPKSDLWMSRTFESRRYLLAHAQDMPDDRRAGRIVAEWAVDYVFVGERTVTGEPRQLDLAGLLESSSWRVAFQQGGAYVFEHLGGASANHHPVASAGTSSTKPSS
jgi:hypothetical protein